MSASQISGLTRVSAQMSFREHKTCQPLFQRPEVLQRADLSNELVWSDQGQSAFAWVYAIGLMCTNTRFVFAFGRKIGIYGIVSKTHPVIWWKVRVVEHGRSHVVGACTIEKQNVEPL